MFQINRPCIPCQHTCDELVCNTTCLADQIQVVHVDITNLALEPRQTGADTNETVLQVYYLTVKALTASGQYVTASSTGVYVDTTPPVVEMLYHIDVAWNPYEPSKYQGDNSTIVVYYQVFDGESEVQSLSYILKYTYLVVKLCLIRYVHDILSQCIK